MGMKVIESTLNSLERELLGMMHEKCESESDIRHQEQRLKQINAITKRIGGELRKAHQAMKQHNARFFN